MLELLGFRGRMRMRNGVSGHNLGFLDLFIHLGGQALELGDGRFVLLGRVTVMRHHLAKPSRPLEGNRLLELVDGDVVDDLGQRNVLLGNRFDLAANLVHLRD